MSSPRTANKKRHRGAAIVMAMGVVALATLVSTSMLLMQSTWSRRQELVDDHAQAQLVIRAGIDFVRAILGDDAHASVVDHLGEPWAQRLAPIPIENGTLTGSIEDQQGRFNLNNLVSKGKADPEQVKRYKRLLTLLNLPEVLAESLTDWLDADREPRTQGGAEDEYYLAMDTPYLTANQPLVDLSELSLVRGYDAAIVSRLLPFVTALPRATAVNVNTAPVEVIAAVVGGLGLDEARAVVARRERAYFRDKADFIESARLDDASVESVVFSSRYFMASARVTIGTAVANGQALLERGDSGWPAVVWRKLF